MSKLVEKIMVEGEITLGQFLKTEGIIESGGQAKWFLKEFDVYLNGEHETRRGKKLEDGDQIDIPEVGSFVIAQQGDQ
ncbi:S4 domain-containing protein YaaA [Staphylococcus condimenti]|uniref:S4 domain-containing protein YaaA n=2 Tax=Staphylococcus TaxID=1279 RepID=A0AB37HBP6_9STAP|nr:MULTISPECIES: S4 domain-containing protein YaaA [Staphylococcus]MDK8646127.1 S4 domain-containing protein YaaA [Staphylococcus condimenti]QQS82361.1 S4 domain-containing protein YaaA [Staphylococcus condimenti]QRP95207.1 S4 domain-containing protein YaaA [Staphylococcus condimenti]